MGVKIRVRWSIRNGLLQCTIDSAVSAVSSAAHLRSLVAVNTGNNDLLQLKALGLGVGLDVAQQVQESLGGLLGPLHLVTGGLVLLGNGVSANATSVLSERDGLLESKHVLQVRSGVGDGSALDSLANLAGVLEVDSQVSSLGLGGCNIVCRNNNEESAQKINTSLLIYLPLTMLSGSWLFGTDKKCMKNGVKK